MELLNIGKLNVLLCMICATSKYGHVNSVLLVPVNGSSVSNIDNSMRTAKLEQRPTIHYLVEDAI